MKNRRKKRGKNNEIERTDIQTKHPRSHFEMTKQELLECSVGHMPTSTAYQCVLSLTLCNLQNNYHLYNCNTILISVSSPILPHYNLSFIQQPEQSLKNVRIFLIRYNCCISLCKLTVYGVLIFIFIYCNVITTLALADVTCLLLFCGKNI